MTDQLAQALQEQANEAQNYIDQARRELQAHMANVLVAWAYNEGDRLGHAAYSAVTGRWEDIPRDLERGHITPEQAMVLLDKLLEYRLISVLQFNVYQKRWAEGDDQTVEGQD